MILELIVTVLFTQDALEGVALIYRQCRVRKRVMVNDGEGCSTIGANCFSHFSILTWHLFPGRSGRYHGRDSGGTMLLAR
jgi:hypothetical protein